jgi:protein gp37
MARTSIEWTECSWNPVTGCSKISDGCAHCYAERMAKRLCAMGQARYRNGFEVTLHPDLLELPLRWRKPRSIFVNSMSDLFHADVPSPYIASVLSTIVRADRHIFQILTKRAERLAAFDLRCDWPRNAMIGVTVEHAKTKDRIKALRATSARSKFISFEPLIGPVGEIDLSGIDWIIVGGESGPGARPMEESWVLDLKRQARERGIPFFFKQWGGVFKKRRGRLLEGRLWEELPAALASVGDYYKLFSIP